ncbi:hypothetical protein D1159_15530, partial [Pseudoflavonifractor sp. 524-17]|uniref:hypothetical protein n=1 Tax=Pseudoflavonifractor sp. 524-17 TaxID=2304577 RepID=UPI001A9A7D2F
PPRFPLPLKTLILLGFLMFSYGNALNCAGPYGGLGASATNKRAPVYTGALLVVAATTTINFTLTLQYLPFDFYMTAVFFSRTQKSKGDI